MSSAKTVTFLDGEDKAAHPPIGCGFSTLSDKCKLYIMLKGIIDIEKEEAKLDKKKTSLLQQIESLQKLMNAPGYETKVPEDVRQRNNEKLSQMSNEVTLIEKGVEQLKLMRS